MANNRFTINGVVYTVGDFDFNTMADLEDYGVSVAQMMNPTSNVLRAYLAVVSGMTPKQAGNELTKHILNGGGFEEMIEAFAESLKNSDFFRKLTEIPDEEDPASQEKEKPKKTRKVAEQ